MCEPKDDVLVTAEEWAVISSGLQTAIAANFKLLAERTELRKQLTELLVLSAPKSQWTSTDEHLPENRIPVLALMKTGGSSIHECIVAAQKEDGKWMAWGSWSEVLPEITHWMPLPATPGDTAAPKQAMSSPSDGWEAMRQLHRELIAKANDCEAGGRLQALHLFAAEKIEKVLAESPAAQAPAQVPEELMQEAPKQ